MNRKTALFGAVSILGAALVAIAFLLGAAHHKEAVETRHINDLLAKATGLAGRPQPVEELARIPGDLSLQALKLIAEDGSTSPEAQTAALKAIAARDGTSGAFLARFLKPEESLAVRMIVAEELERVACPDECVRLVIRYQERIARGDPTTEDTLISAGLIDEQLLATDRGRLNNAITSVVHANGLAARRVLREEYGFGTALPSQVGLSIAVADNLQVVCIDLNHSHFLLESDPAPLRDLRLALVRAISSLGCSDGSRRPPSG